ncbi:MAG: hypothetical protein F6K58_11080 [Symploca sp. SIO2E9]|nr:hypothetical protein [Symploca sp. SIO2E9]
MGRGGDGEMNILPPASCLLPPAFCGRWGEGENKLNNYNTEILHSAKPTLRMTAK